MSINVLKNETLTVTETVGGYKLTARRFGHGVGMSQRGAQQMANEGISYDQILEFYYPGLTRTRYTMTRTLLAAIDGTTQTPDEPVTDAKIAVITLQNPLDSLNLRQQASTASPVLARMPHGTQVNLLEKLGDWSKIQYGTLTGYVMTGYLTIQEDGVEETPPGGKRHRHGDRRPFGRKPDAQPARRADDQFLCPCQTAPRSDTDGAGTL